MSTTERPCPCCGVNDVIPLFDNRMALISGLDMSYKVGRCRKCGFCFAYSLADDQTFHSYYQSLSKYDIAGKISELDQLRIDAAVKICRDKIHHDATIIDLGCGYGALLSGFKMAGWINLYGIDPAPNSAERAHELFGLEKIYCGTMAQACYLLPLAKADLVCITGVLEHLPHLRDEVFNVLKNLQPGCQVLVEVPALERFSGFNSEPFGEFSLEHIQFFSAASLQNFFGSLGAKPLALEIVDLPVGSTDSLFGLFQLTSEALIPFESLPADDDAMARYISDSRRRLDNALSRVSHERLVIYGAGSHTARLLPHLEKMTNGCVIAVVDNNPNLLNKNIGKWVIEPPSIIALMPDAHILISSFRFQNEIAANLRVRYPNPLILLYD